MGESDGAQDHASHDHFGLNGNKAGIANQAIICTYEFIKSLL
jgi:hypothetical protein